MNPRQRVLKVMQNEEPDKIPVLVRAMAQKLRYEYAEKYEINPENEIFFWRDLTPLISMGIDAFDFSLPIKKPKASNLPELKKGQKIDAFGRISEKGAYTQGFLTNEERLESFPDPKMASEEDPTHFKKMSNMAGDKIAPFCSLRGFFELTWEGMGLRAFGKAQRKNIGFIVKVIDRIQKITETQLKLALEQGIELFSLTDDMGFKSGLITRLSFYQKHIFPRYKKLIDMIHKKGGLVYLHSEGKITEAMPSIIDAGFDGVQALTEMDGINLEKIKNKFGSKIAFLGTFAHSPMLDMWDEQRIRKKIRYNFRVAGKGGGLMMGPSAMIDKGCDLKKVLIMIDAIHNCTY